MELWHDKELIENYIKTHSNESARIIVEKYRRFVFSTALNFTKSFDDAEDLAQETFLNAFQNLHTFQFKSSFNTWLYRILKNIFLNNKAKKNIDNTLQRNNIESFIENICDYKNPETELEYKELLNKFYRAIDKLPKKQKEVFILRYFDEVKYEDMSEMLDLTVGGLKANYFHAIKKIIENFKNE